MAVTEVTDISYAYSGLVTKKDADHPGLNFSKKDPSHDKCDSSTKLIPSFHRTSTLPSIVVVFFFSPIALLIHTDCISLALQKDGCRTKC